MILRSVFVLILILGPLFSQPVFPIPSIYLGHGVAASTLASRSLSVVRDSCRLYPILQTIRDPQIPARHVWTVVPVAVLQLNGGLVRVYCDQLAASIASACPGNGLMDSRPGFSGLLDNICEVHLIYNRAENWRINNGAGRGLVDIKCLDRVLDCFELGRKAPKCTLADASEYQERYKDIIEEERRDLDL